MKAMASMQGNNDRRSTATKYEVLLVEDNLVNQRVLGKQLQKAGHNVIVANHGQEALQHLQESNFWKDNADGKPLHVILMDLEMPVMDGLTASRTIREFEVTGVITRHVPIIAVTANARKEQIDTCLQAGMVSLLHIFLASLIMFQDDVMPKPFRVAELTAKIEKLLSR